jgi:YVTN family beta-propeller protein
MTPVRSNRITLAHQALASVAALTLAACGGATVPEKDIVAQTLIATVPVSGCPYGVAVSSAGVGYVTSICGSTVTRFNAIDASLGASIGVGQTPAHVAIDPSGTTAYVTNQTPQSVTVVDIATNASKGTIPLPGSDAFNLRVSPDGSRLYVTRADGKLFVINTADRSILATVNVGPAANGLAFHPNQPILYVSSIQAGTVAAINTQTNTVQRTYTLGGAPQRIAVSNDGTELYAANEVSGMDVVNLSTGGLTSVALPKTGGGYGAGLGLALAKDGNYAYVTMPNLGLVQIVDVKARTIYKTIFTGGDPRNVAIAKDGGVVVADQSGYLRLIR